MTVNQWLQANLPKNKTTLSVDAVEILIKLAWAEASKSTEKRPRDSREIIGPYAIEELD